MIVYRRSMLNSSVPLWPSIRFTIMVRPFHGSHSAVKRSTVLSRLESVPRAEGGWWLTGDVTADEYDSVLHRLAMAFTKPRVDDVSGRSAIIHDDDTEGGNIIVAMPFFPAEDDDDDDDEIDWEKVTKRLRRRYGF